MFEEGEHMGRNVRNKRKPLKRNLNYKNGSPYRKRTIPISVGQYNPKIEMVKN